jgi:hypothetical protein
MMQYQRYAEFACSSSLELIQVQDLARNFLAIMLESYMHIRNCFNLWDGSSLDLRSKACWLQPKPEPLCPGFPHPAKHKIQPIRKEAIQNPQDVDNKKLGLLLTVTRI